MVGDPLRLVPPMAGFSPLSPLKMEHCLILLFCRKMG